MAVMQEVKLKKKSLRDILPPKENPTRIPPPPHYTEIPTRASGGKKHRWLWVALGLVLFAIIYFVSIAFARVTIEITPTSLDLNLNENLVITKSGGALNFDVITLPARVATKSVKASGVEKVSRPASGQVVVYNNYSSAPQKLIANTRFQAKNDKIYRIREAVTVPGTKLVSGKTVPGSVEVTVYADQPGPEYNGEPTDFTIPGFKGDPRFNKFFGRSKTPLAGGFTGEVRKLSPEEAKSAMAALNAELTKELLNEARAKIPATSILFDGAALVDIKDVSEPALGTGDSATLKASATMQGVLLTRAALVEKLVEGKMPGFSATEVTITNLDKLNISLSDLPSGNLSDVKTLTLQIRGSARLIPVINQTDLANKLVGFSRSELKDYLKQTKGVDSYRAIFSPVWLSRIPADLAKITIKLPAY